MTAVLPGSPNGAPPPSGIAWTSPTSDITGLCGGCRGFGAHVRWCPEVVGPLASKLGRASERVEEMADEIGSSSPQAANDLYRVAAYLRAEATDTPTATCVVCGATVTSWVHHQRLNVDVCLDCPLTDVQGEDITGHTVTLHVEENS